MIIDAHAHVGQCHVFDADQSGANLLKAMDSHGIDSAVVQPFPGSRDVRADHDAIAALGRENPGRIIGLASVNPHLPEREYVEEVRRCVTDLGFVGVKLHTIGHAVAPGSAAARLVFSTAAETGVAVMIHTGPGVPFAEPAAWISLAREFSAVPVVLAHAGASLFVLPAIAAAEVCDNVVLETSWCNPQDVRRAVATLGEEKVMFGSDMLFNIEPELTKYRAVGFVPEKSPQLFEGTARRAFGIGEAQR